MLASGCRSAVYSKAMNGEQPPVIRSMRSAAEALVQHLRNRCAAVLGFTAQEGGYQQQCDQTEFFLSYEPLYAQHAIPCMH